MKTLFLASILFSGCVSPLPEEVLKDNTQLLESARSLYYGTCVQLAKTPDMEGRCSIADAHLAAAIEIYTVLRELEKK